MSQPGQPPNEDEIMTCWCGEQGKPEDLFNWDGVPTRCGGAGFVICHCGGDNCVCHHHGEIECPGCFDCDNARSDDDWEPDDIVDLGDLYDDHPA